MLRDEAIAYQKEQYDEKNEILRSFGEQVSAVALYEDIFGDIDRVMPIVIIDEDEQKHIVKMTIDEAISYSEGRNYVLMGGTVYFNQFISKATAKEIYALIIDMDNVYSGILQLALQNDWKRAGGESVPQPTYIVNSGTGLHLYFLLDTPLQCYHSQLVQIDQLYRKLAEMETTGYNYLQKSVQWFGQDFRMAGSCGKNGWENTVFKIGQRWSADQLGKAVGLSGVHFYSEGEPRVKPKVGTQQRTSKFKRTGYHLNSRVYETSVDRCRSETHEGHRYTSMCALSVLAYKCNIPLSRLEKDLKSLIPFYNRKAERKMRENEIYSAMKMYNSKALTTPRERTEEWLEWEFVGAKRNGRRQDVHIKTVNAMRKFRRDELGEDEYKNNGRPIGSGTAQQRVQQWRSEHPDGSKSQCKSDTGLSYPTIRKWWDLPYSESKQISPWNSKNVKKYEFECRGCSIGSRKQKWYNFVSSIRQDSDNSYLEFEEEPDNQYDPNAVKVIVRGDFFGMAGYVGKEYTGDIKAILSDCSDYRVDMKDQKQAGCRSIWLVVSWI